MQDPLYGLKEDILPPELNIQIASMIIQHNK